MKMDGNALFVINEAEQENLIQTKRTCSQDKEMEFGLENRPY